MKILLILILLGVIGLLLFPQLEVEVRDLSGRKPPAPKSEVSAPAEEREPEDLGAVAPKSKMATVFIGRSSDLVVIRGVVLGECEGILLVDCLPDPDPPNLFFAGGATSAGESASFAQWSIKVRDQGVLEAFGPLLMMSEAGLHRATMPPSERPIGKVALAGLEGSDSRIHVVAAPTGNKVDGLKLYSARFQIGAPTAQDRSIYPPGVDTPEERREYLKAHRAGRRGN